MRRPVIKILYEDANMLAINKPAGISVHSGDGESGPTIAEWAVEKYPKMKKIGEPERPGVVHRLDKDTSGVLLLAKTTASYNSLKKQFHDRNIKKVYWAIVYGAPKDERGIIDRPIGHSRGDYVKRAVGAGARGELRQAITYFKVLKRWDGYSLLELRPKTGRTHQLRVHLKSVNHPVICDPIYAPGSKCLKDMGRLALHAKSIEFNLIGGTIPGSSGKTLKIEAPLPKDMDRTIAGLDNLA